VPTPTDAPLTFFVDRSLGAHDVPDALRTAGVLVEIHDDHFAHDTPDTVWLAEVGACGWVVLTKDSRIRRHPLELQALLAANVAAFMLTATDLTGADMGHLLLQVHRGAEPVFDCRELVGVERAPPGHQLVAIEGGDLMADGYRAFAQAAGAFFQRDGRGPADALLVGRRTRDHDDAAPGLDLVEAVVGDHQHGPPSALLGA